VLTFRVYRLASTFYSVVSQILFCMCYHFDGEMKLLVKSPVSCVRRWHHAMEFSSVWDSSEQDDSFTDAIHDVIQAQLGLHGGYHSFVVRSSSGLAVRRAPALTSLLL